jgi:aspartate aminotransferase-like enzyme
VDRARDRGGVDRGVLRDTPRRRAPPPGRPDWVRQRGFDFFAQDGYRSKTLTCVRNTRGIDVPRLARDLREKHHLVIDPGYGKIKGLTFRLSNMGDETEETVAYLLNCLDDVLR